MKKSNRSPNLCIVKIVTHLTSLSNQKHLESVFHPSLQYFESFFYPPPYSVQAATILSLQSMFRITTHSKNTIFWITHCKNKYTLLRVHCTNTYRTGTKYVNPRHQYIQYTWILNQGRLPWSKYLYREPSSKLSPSIALSPPNPDWSMPWSTAGFVLVAKDKTRLKKSFF